MSKHKKSRSKKASFPVAILAPAIFTGYTLGKEAMSGEAGMKNAREAVTGMDDNGFRGDLLLSTYGPMVVGLVIHKVASKAGLNKALAAAGIPYLRV